MLLAGSNVGLGKALCLGTWLQYLVFNATGSVAMGTEAQEPNTGEGK